MKVVVEGTLRYEPGRTIVAGWSVDIGGQYATLREGESNRKLIACVLIHIGGKLGVDLVESSAAARETDEVEQPLPECFDAQRETLDAIAVARWREQGE